MYSTQLTAFAQIDGVGAASGLFIKDDLLFIVGDNSGYLNVYHIGSKKLDKIQILFRKDIDKLENIPKVLKPDFEILCQHENKLYILGSGSTQNRNLMVEYDLQTNRINQKDLSVTYSQLKSIGAVDDQNFNLEGAIFTGKEWLLFNRGNGSGAKNGIFKIGDADLLNPHQVTFTPTKLPNIKHVEASFTDAILINRKIFFIATAEDTESTYQDGEILGSFIGGIDPDTLKLTFSHKIPASHKFEGITFLKQTSDQIEFLLCEDRDTEELKTTVYKLTMNT